ncbi:MAG: hypothetical protein WDO13_16780 [Verrucomicrobiota bacterium]
MKIVFACGCLEPGRDGVGDYTRRLAGQLAARGHDCHLLALADPHVREPLRADLPCGDATLPALRLPFAAPWPQRIAEARAYLGAIAPDWMSWQVVLYGFDPRGLCLGLGERFRQIAGDTPSEIMFHELWIGEADGTPLKRRLLGQVQRHVLADLLRRLRPRVVHTHIELYRRLLGRLGRHGAAAKILPLFGNIPVAPKAAPGWLAEKWPAGVARIAATGREAWWLFVLFGSIHPEWDGDDFFRRASAAAKAAGKRVAFLSLGRAGAAGEATLRRLAAHDGDAWLTHTLGPLPEADISQGLLTADFGVSPVPPEYLGKSGTAIAMLEHGLPVIVTRPPYRYRRCPADRLRVTTKNVVLDFDLAAHGRIPPRPHLPLVAAQFVADLSAA